MQIKSRFAKVLSVLLSVLIIFIMLPGGLIHANAAENQTTLNIGDGSIMIGNGTVSQNGNSLTYNSNGYIITGSATTSNTISVVGGTQNITLANVNIDVSSSGCCAFSIMPGAVVNLTLSGSNSLTSGSVYAGLQVPKGAELFISGGGSDFLSAAGGYVDGGSGAGIGSQKNTDSGTIHILGGSITATGRFWCAGLGGGFAGNCGTVYISGGSVTATASGRGGAGLGGGANANGGTVYISGGIVRATSNSQDASGIGGGSADSTGNTGNGGAVYISGGTVYAAGGSTGIGAGAYYSTIRNGGTVSITGGSVNAAIQNRPTNGSSPVYRTTVSVPAGKSVSSFAVKQGGSAYTYGVTDIQTDGNSYGKLYLWLPASVGSAETTADVTTDGNVYTGYHGTVSTSDSGILKMNQILTGLKSAYTYGEPVFACVTRSGSAYTATLDYKNTDSLADYDATPPTNAGNYSLSATCDGDNAYLPLNTTQHFVINPKLLTEADVTEPKTVELYTGQPFTPVTVKDSDTVLTKETDYTIINKATGGTAFTFTDVGIYDFTIIGIGNYKGTINKGFTIETAPTISVDGNPTLWCTQATLSITPHTGSTGLQSVTVSNGAKLTDITFTYSSGYLVKQNGTYTVTVTDNAGYSNSTQVNVDHIDTVSPTISVFGNPTSPVQAAKLTITATAGLSKIKSVAVKGPDGNQNLTDTYQNGYTVTQNGTYTFTVTNNAGVESIFLISVTQTDTAKPLVVIDSNFYPDGTWTNKNVKLDVFSTTANLGVTTFEYSTNNGVTWAPFNASLTDATEGITTYSLRATSESGVVSDIQCIIVKLDKTAPESHQITITDNHFTTFLNTITFGLFFKNTQTAAVAAADSGSGIASIQYQLVHSQNDYNEAGTWTDYPGGGIGLNPDNKYVVYAKIADTAGNYVIINSDGVIVDETRPDLSLSVPSGWQTGSTLLACVTADDALAGLQSVSYTTDETTPQSGTVSLTDNTGSITLTNEGDYALTVTAVDKSGNTISRTAQIQWDKTPPTISVLGNPTGPVQSAKLAVTATAGTSGIKNVAVSGPNGNQDLTDTYQNGCTVTQNGTYTFTVTNNAGVESSFQIPVTQIDTAKPVAVIDSNSYTDGVWTNKNVKLDVSNTTANLGTTTFEYSPDGGTTWAPFSGSLTGSIEGITAYSFRATSESGVVSDIQCITVKLDKTAPTNTTITFTPDPFKVAVHFLTFGLFFGNTANVTFSANDTNGSGVDHYEHQTVAWGDTFNPAGTWQTEPLSVQPGGKVTIYARSVDKTGNVSGAVAKSIVVDNTVPVIVANAGDPALNTLNANTNIPVEVKDGGAGVGSVTYQVNGGAPKTLDLTANGYTDLTTSYSFNISDLPDGIYDVVVNAQDNAGNAAVTATVHVTKNAAQAGFGFASAALSKTYGNAPFTVGAIGGQGNGAVVYSVTSGSGVLSVNTETGKVTIRKAGAAVVTATKAASNGYRAAMASLPVIVSKAASTVQVPPTASALTVIGKLSASKLTGGAGSVAGTFTWAHPDTVVASSGSYDVIFTPADTDDYKTVAVHILVTVTMLLTDGSSGEQIDFTGVTLPSGVTSVSLDSVIQRNESSVDVVIKNLIEQDETLDILNGLTVYDLKLLDQNGNPIETFTGSIKVKIPVRAGMSGNLKVFSYNPADGTLTDMNAIQENEFLVFETTHFSYYAVAELTVQSSKNNYNSWPLTPLVVLGVGAATGIAIVRRRKIFKVKSTPHEKTAQKR